MEPLGQIRVEREGYGFFVELWYENLPSSCSYCYNIGHTVSECRHATRQTEKSVDKTHTVRAANSQYRPKVSSGTIEKAAHKGSSEVDNLPTKESNVNDGTVPMDKVGPSSGVFAPNYKVGPFPSPSKVTAGNDGIVRIENVGLALVHNNNLNSLPTGGSSVSVGTPSQLPSHWSDISDEDGGTYDLASTREKCPSLPSKGQALITTQEDPGITPCFIVPTADHPTGDQVELVIRAMSNHDIPFTPVLSKSHIQKLKQQDKVAQAPVYALRGRKHKS